MPNSGQANWNRGLRGGGDIRVLPGRYGPGEIQGTRKRILPELWPLVTGRVSIMLYMLSNQVLKDSVYKDTLVVQAV